jgi:hypothetical protein
MHIVIYLAVTLGVVSVLLLVSYIAHTRTKATFDEEMAIYRRAVEKAKLRALQTQQEASLQNMSLRHRRPT